MLLVCNVQMNTDFGTLYNREAERSTCKASTLVFCWGPATESSDTRGSGTTDLYRNVPVLKILYICCPDKKHSKGRRLDHLKRRKGWRWNACAVTYRFRNVTTAHAIFFSKIQLWLTCCIWILAFKKKKKNPKPFCSSKLQKKKTPSSQETWGK